MIDLVCLMPESSHTLNTMANSDPLRTILAVTNSLAITLVHFDKRTAKFRRTKNRHLIVFINVTFITILSIFYQWYVLSTFKSDFELNGVIVSLLGILDGESVIAWIYVMFLNTILKSKYILRSLNKIFEIKKKIKSNPVSEIKRSRIVLIVQLQIFLSVFYNFVFITGSQIYSSNWTRTWLFIGIDLTFASFGVLGDLFIIMFNTFLITIRTNLQVINERLNKCSIEADDLTLLIESYFEAMALINLLGKAFTMPILFAIFTTFFEGTTQLYQIFAMISTQTDLELGSLIKEVVSYGVWLCPQLAKLCITMKLASSVSDEVILSISI